MALSLCTQQIEVSQADDCPGNNAHVVAARTRPLEVGLHILLHVEAGLAVIALIERGIVALAGLVGLQIIADKRLAIAYHLAVLIAVKGYPGVEAGLTVGVQLDDALLAFDAG